MKHSGAVKCNRLKKMMPYISARCRRASSPDVHLCEFQTILDSLHRISAGAVQAYSWNIRHHKREYPRIRIHMLVDNMATVAAAAAILADAFEDIDNIAFVLTVDIDAYYEMVTLDWQR